jgi:hypothetical protein
VTDIAVRELRFGRVWRANPMRVVEERAGMLVLWSPRGSVRILPLDPDGGEIRIPREDFELGERTTAMDCLWLALPARPYSLGLFWDDGRFGYWYVNFERHLGRGATTYDYVDQKLDLVVAPDGGVRWKDEDELEQAARLGLLDEAAVRADAERVLAEPPWPTGWEGFRPDPAWPPPELPPGWDVV